MSAFEVQLVIISLLSSFILFTLIFLPKWASRGKKRPPSPRGLPIIGNLHQLGALPHRWLQSLSRHHGDHGHLLLLHLGQVPVLLVSSAEAAREVMKNQDAVFSNRPRLSVQYRLLYGGRDVAFSTYGEYWRQVRSICVLQLLSNKRVQSFRGVREQETSMIVDRIRQLKSSSSAPVNLCDVLVSLTNDVFCRVALGGKYSGDRQFNKFLDEINELLGATTMSLGDYIPWLGWVDRVNGLNAKVEKVFKIVDDFLETVIQQHRDQGRKDDHGDGEFDFVDILLEFQTENMKNSSPVEDDTIKALILDMFIAGTDTTVSALVWAIAELIKNPRTMITLQNEVRQVAGTKDEIDEDDVEKMPYLKAVIKESLRLHPPLPLLVRRESISDTKVMGYDISAGTQVMINFWAIARDPSLWEHPSEFWPERFLGSDIDFKGLHFELIPFGAGRRGCPGIAFAVAVDELALAKLVHHFNFELANGEKGEDLDMSESIGLTAHKKLPLLVVPYERERIIK